MNLPDLSIRRPVTSTMMILIIMVLGFVALSRIGIDFFPDLQFPVSTQRQRDYHGCAVGFVRGDRDPSAMCAGDDVRVGGPQTGTRPLSRRCRT